MSAGVKLSESLGSATNIRVTSKQYEPIRSHNHNLILIIPHNFEIFHTEIPMNPLEIKSKFSVITSNFVFGVWKGKNNKKDPQIF